MTQVAEEPIRIVINYRRRDAGGEAGHLYTDLVARFGSECVFLDIENIEPGLDFKKVIKDAIVASDVLIALIGRRWLTAVDDEGQRRLHQDDDQLRSELELGMRRKVRVVPVLVQGAQMPQASDVPATLKKFCQLHALQITERRQPDVDALVEFLEKLAGEKAQRLAAAGPATLEEERSRKAAFDYARHAADALQLQSLREDVARRRQREHDLLGQLGTQQQQRRRWKVGAFAVAAAAVVVSALALVVPAGSGGGGGGVTDKTVTVAGRDMWTDTGIDLDKGERVTIVASGMIDTHQPDPARRSGPEGKPGEVNVPANIVQEIGHGALIRRIGGATPRGAGASITFTAENEGRLLLGVNDWNFETNAGAFTVHVTTG